MRDDHCHVYAIRVDHSFDSWRKLSIWGGQEVMPRSKNGELYTAAIVNSE
jgi:hypothetical protein